MPRLLKLLHRNYRALRNGELIDALKSELKHELSSNPFQANQLGSLGDFTLDWDAPQSQDVVLRKRNDLGEEIAVSALLSYEGFEGEGVLPRRALMKVCITKPGLSPLLQFDCDLSSKGADGSEFNICNAYYLRSPACLGASNYKGPLFRANCGLHCVSSPCYSFHNQGIGLKGSSGNKPGWWGCGLLEIFTKSSLDPQLQNAFKAYLIGRGIGEELTNFLLLHLHKKEQGQYVNWLRKLEIMFEKGA